MNKAGRALRAFRAAATHDPEAWRATIEALDVLDAWRAAHAGPLQAASMGLRSRCMTAKAGGAVVSQRLKRLPTILDKLTREPGELGRMADIAGCRAVVATVADVRRVQGRYVGKRTPRRVKDYILEPKPTGYRALHLIIDHASYLVEVQLRTVVMHEWAVMVELVGNRVGVDLKSGAGPQPVTDWFQAISEAMALEDEHRTVPPQLIERIATLRAQALPLLVPGGTSL